MKGYAGRILEVDLAARTHALRPLDGETARLYLGGKGYATRLLYDTTAAGIDPLGPENPLVFATGPLNGSVAPQSNRFAVVCKSPLTGAIGGGTCGGSFAHGMKRAGIDALVVRGRADAPIRLEFDGDRDELRFLDARDLWGKGTRATQEALGRAMAHAVIGPAGENLVLFAGIVSDQRIAGRTGVGAVMGSKRLKAVSLRGSRRLEMDDPAAFAEYTRFVRATFRDHPVLGEKLARFGTAGIVSVTNARNILPVRNFARGHHPDAMLVSGEHMEEHGLVGVRSSCIHCPVTCGREVEVEGAGRVKGPEYETVALLGPNLEIFDLSRVSEWNWLADDLGMDTISLGTVIGFAMELEARGALRAGVRFGDPSGVSDLIRDVAHRRGIGNDLADGVRRMSERWGGREYAMHVKGLEMSAYDPRGSFAQGVEYATTSRGGDHIQGASMYAESVGPLTMDPQTLRMKAELPVLAQNLACSVSSMVICMFTVYGVFAKPIHALDPKSLRWRALAAALERSGPLVRAFLRLDPRGPVWRALDERVRPFVWFERWLTHVTGERTTFLGIQETGARIFNLERMYNLREGLTGTDDALPDRILHEPTFRHMRSGHPLHLLLPRYYRARGWDRAGVPTRDTLERLRVRT